MTSETIILIIVALFGVMLVLSLALGLVLWLIPPAARLVIAFTVFLMELPLLVTVLVFILFPPTLIVFLMGLALMRWFRGNFKS
jgi:hypothetical protein